MECPCHYGCMTKRMYGVQRYDGYDEISCVVSIGMPVSKGAPKRCDRSKAPCKWQSFVHACNAQRGLIGNLYMSGVHGKGHGSILAPDCQSSVIGHIMTHHRRQCCLMLGAMKMK